MLCSGQSEYRIQFVDSSISFNTDVIFADAWTTEESRITCVARSCVDFHRLNTRFVDFKRASLASQRPFFEAIHSTFHGKGLYYEQIIGIY